MWNARGSIQFRYFRRTGSRSGIEIAQLTVDQLAISYNQQLASLNRAPICSVQWTGGDDHASLRAADIEFDFQVLIFKVTGLRCRSRQRPPCQSFVTAKVMITE